MFWDKSVHWYQETGQNKQMLMGGLFFGQFSDF